MSDAKPEPGHPFPGTYPPIPEAERIHRLRLAVERQAVELTQRRHEPSFRRQLIASLQRRRRGLGIRGQVDAVRRAGAAERLIVRGELLISAASFADRDARGFLAAHGFVREELGCDELEPLVVRLSNRDLDPQDVDDAARLLRMRGFAASVNHLAPLAPVGKGLGGPEPTAPLGPLAKYPVRDRGEPVRVGVIDTGITAEVRSDGWLAAVPRGDDIDPLDALPVPDGYLDLDAGHGTFVSGIVQQVAPGTEIRTYRALDSDGVGSELDVAAAMIRAAGDGCRILNLSLGCQTADDQPSIAIGAALEVLGRAEDETLVVAAAGNDGDSTPCWPAAFRGVVAVAGLTPDLRPTSWSSRGFWITCSTVAQGVRSTYVEGRESHEIDPRPDTFGPDAWAVWSGTSFAAPQIAGAVARVCQLRGCSPRRALAWLLASGKPVPDFGRAVKLLPGV